MAPAAVFGPSLTSNASAQLGVSTGQRSIPVDSLGLFWRVIKYSYIGMFFSLDLCLKEQSSSWRKKGNLASLNIRTHYPVMARAFCLLSNLSL